MPFLKPTSRALVNTPPQAPPLQILLFSVGALSLALRMEGVKKVIPMPTIFKTGNKLLGLAHVEDQDVIVLDLHQQLYGQSIARSRGYLILLQTPKNIYGIPVEMLPLLKQIPADALQPVPPDYRDRDTLGIADSMVQIALSDNQETTAFVLDPDCLMTLVGTNPT